MSTATTAGARDHARAQADGDAAAAIRGKPTIPAADAIARPPDVAPLDMVWDEVLEAGEYSAHRLCAGSILRLADLEGDACAHVVVHHADLPSERYNPADTTKVQWAVYPTTGALLLSDRGRALMAIVADTSGRHDTLCAPPHRASCDAKYGDGRVEGPTPNARDRLLVALAKFGLDRRDLGPSFSFFKGVRVEPDGSLHLVEAAPAQAAVHLRAELDVYVSVVNAPHILDRRVDYTCTPLQVTAWRGRPLVPDDPFRCSTPERARAYRNNDDWQLGR